MNCQVTGQTSTRAQSSKTVSATSPKTTGQSPSRASHVNCLSITIYSLVPKMVELLLWNLTSNRAARPDEISVQDIQTDLIYSSYLGNSSTAVLTTRSYNKYPISWKPVAGVWSLMECNLHQSPSIFGVPQGTVLDPILILLPINDVPSHATWHIRLFTDEVSYTAP